MATYSTRGDVPDARGISRFEQTAWGLRCQSPDGRYRDLWLPSKTVGRTDRPAAELAAAAYVLATGEEGPRPRWDGPFTPAGRQSPRPERVRIFAYGCTEGEPHLLLDWDQEETRQQYLEHAVPALRRASLGTEARPGTSCVSCKAVSGCAKLPRTSGLWGGAPGGTPRPRRSLSAWDLRVHTTCPAQYHLTRQLGIKALLPETDATVRGRLVDKALELRHRAQPARPCREAPRPADPADWGADEFRLTGDAAMLAAAMLAQHDALCPLGSRGPRDLVQPTHQLTSYIPELDVVVMATPDLLYTRGDAWYWRETKTSSSRLYERKPLMRQYPQLALAVLLMNARVPEGELHRSRVEFELLHADDCVLEVLDPSRPAVVAEARELVAELAEPLLRDAGFEPAPEEHCHRCEVRSWCTPGREYTTERLEQGTRKAPAQDR
ncbi:PD-(D/E)XK nuclease family protein [Kitasatospora sp. NPDC004289]